MCADVAGFVLAYHNSPRRCCLWIEVTPTENEFPSPQLIEWGIYYISGNIRSRSSQERGGQILTLQ